MSHPSAKGSGGTSGAHTHWLRDMVRRVSRLHYYTGSLHLLSEEDPGVTWWGSVHSITASIEKVGATGQNSLSH